MQCKLLALNVDGNKLSLCQLLFEAKMDGDRAKFVPLPYCTEGCVVCEKVDTGVTLMTPESRDVMARQLQVLAEDIRRMEARLAKDKPLFVHQDCLKPSKLPLSSGLHCLAKDR